METFHISYTGYYLLYTASMSISKAFVEMERKQEWERVQWEKGSKKNPCWSCGAPAKMPVVSYGEYYGLNNSTRQLMYVQAGDFNLQQKWSTSGGDDIREQVNDDVNKRSCADSQGITTSSVDNVRTGKAGIADNTVHSNETPVDLTKSIEQSMSSHEVVSDKEDIREKTGYHEPTRGDALNVKLKNEGKKIIANKNRRRTQKCNCI